MAFSNGFGERNDEFPFRPSQAPLSDSPFGDFPAQFRNNAMNMGPPPQPNDRRASLQRRFTTESSGTPTMTPAGQYQYGRMADPGDLSTTVRYLYYFIRSHLAFILPLLDFKFHSTLHGIH